LTGAKTRKQLVDAMNEMIPYLAKFSTSSIIDEEEKRKIDLFTKAMVARIQKD